MTKLKKRLLKEATARPAERVSRGWISEGYSHAKGPYDQAYALHLPYFRFLLVVFSVLGTNRGPTGRLLFMQGDLAKRL